MTAGQTKLKPMPDNHFKGMVWWYKRTDFIWNPKRRLKKIPLKEGMVVVDYGCGPGRYTVPISKLIGPTGKVFAVDIHELAIEAVKKKIGKLGLKNVVPILAQGYDSTLPNRLADVVCAIDMFHMNQ